MRTRLVVSLSGIGGQTLDQCGEFAAELDRRQVPLSLLVAPGSRPEPPAVRWLHDRAAWRDSIVLHGFDHAAGSSKRLLPRLASSPRRPTGALRGAEFAVLPAHEAGLRLVAALALMERMSLGTDLFVPPRWFASPGTVRALKHHGFAVCADALAIRELDRGMTHRARVHGLGPGERMESWWCRALVSGVSWAARRGGMVRLAVDASDLRRPGSWQAVLDSVDLALFHEAIPTTYAEFAGSPRVPPPWRSELGRQPLNRDPLSS